MLSLLCLLLISTDPTAPAALLRQGLLALQHGQLTEARQDLEQASLLDPNNGYVWSSLAETYLRLNEPEKASAAADKAEKVGSGNPVVSHALVMFYFDYAQALLRGQDFTRAAGVLTAALSAHADEPQLTLALGVARYGQRRFEDSIVLFLKVVEIDPGIEQPYLFLSRLLDQAGPHLTQITKDFEGLATREPQNAKAQLLLAKALLANDSHNPNAEMILRRSIALDANDWESHYDLGVLLSNKHTYQEAATELERSIELDPKQPSPHYHLARVYDRLGQPDRAKAEREIHQRLTAPAGQ